MALYDKASLVLIPSGTKEGVCFSQKPTNGDGDFTFTRASSATRVNSDGLIEKERVSLFTYNTDFTNGAWTKQSVTIAADQVANPINGAVDADLFYPTISGKYKAIRRLLPSASQTYVGFSIYAKAAGKDFLYFNDPSGTRQIVFNLSTGTYNNTSATAISMESLSGGWYRCSFSVVTDTFYMSVSDSTGSTSVTANGTDGIYVWGQQAEYGIPTDFLGVTTTSPIYEGITDNIPRLDYTDASCPSLLLEPQRTNLVPHSEYFGDYTLADITLTENSTLSPDGTQNATLIESTATAPSYIYDSTASVTIGNTYTFSVFAKKGNNNWIRIAHITSAATAAWFDLENGVIGTVNSLSATIKDYGNGWYRCTNTFVATHSSGLLTFVGISDSDNSTNAGAIGQNDYIWGWQLEEATYPTSYIPTYGSSVTRVGDSCSKTGISSLIGDSEGTILIDFEYLEGGSNVRLALSDGTTSNRVVFGVSSGDQFFYRVDNVGDGGFQFGEIQGSTSPNTRIRAAVRYSQDDFTLYIDGTEVIQVNSGNTFTSGELTRLAFDQGDGSSSLYGNVKQLTVFPTALTDEELADLTTI